MSNSRQPTVGAGGAGGAGSVGSAGSGGFGAGAGSAGAVLSEAVLEAMAEADAYAAAEAVCATTPPRRSNCSTAAAAAGAGAGSGAGAGAGAGAGGGDAYRHDGCHTGNSAHTAAGSHARQPFDVHLPPSSPASSASPTAAAAWQRDDIVFGAAGVYGNLPARAILDASFLSTISTASAPSLPLPLPPQQQQQQQQQQQVSGRKEGADISTGVPSAFPLALQRNEGEEQGAAAAAAAAAATEEALPTRRSEALNTDGLRQLRANYADELNRIAIQAQSRAGGGLELPAIPTSPASSMPPPAPTAAAAAAAAAAWWPTRFPKDHTGLLRLREDFAMELLWAKQAVASRKDYLRIKKELNVNI